MLSSYHYSKHLFEYLHPINLLKMWVWTQHTHTTRVCMYLCVYVCSVKDFVHKLLGLVLFFLSLLSSLTFSVIVVIICNKVRFSLLSVLRIFFFLSLYFDGFCWEFLRVWEKKPNSSHFAREEKTVIDEKSKHQVLSRT